jgi:hypothetical protein
VRGDGSLFLRGSTWWCACYVAGKRIQRSLRTRDQKTARAAMEEFRVRLGDGPGEVAGPEGRVLRWYPFGKLNVAEATGPLVYAWTRRNVVLYIGMSERGLARPFGSTHHRLGKRLLPTDGLLVFRCQSARQAARVERALIAAIRPPVNG